jgi:hypothetical protein
MSQKAEGKNAVFNKKYLVTGRNPEKKNTFLLIK